MRLEGEHHTGGNPWSVLLVEGCDIYRMGIDRAIRRDDRLAVVASCKGPIQARDWLGSQQVDCIVMGLGDDSDSFGCLNLIKWIKAEAPKVTIVILAEGTDHDWICRILRVGVRTVLTRSVKPDILVAAIMKGLAGREYIDPTISCALLGHLFVEREETEVDTWRLTDREAEVLEVFASGVPTATISAKLGLAQRTINVHLKRMQAKLGARNSKELLVQAVRWQCGRGMKTARSGSLAGRI